MYIESNADFNADPVWFALGNPIERTVDQESPAEQTPQEPMPTLPATDSGNNPSTTPVESSRENPLAIGQVGTVGDFDVSVVSVTANANDIVTADGFSEPPTSGNQYFMAAISVTYVGSSAGNPAFDLNPQAVGSSSISYTTFNNMCGFGSFEGSLLLATELFAGGSGEYTVCWQIASEDADSLVMYIESNTDFNADPVWFSLQP